MARDRLAKKYFMLDLHTCHIEEVVDAFVHRQLFRKHRRVLILDRVSTLQATREVHRHEPTRDKTGMAEKLSDRPKDLFTARSRFGVEFPKPLANSSAMIPLLGLDLLYTVFFG